MTDLRSLYSPIEPYDIGRLRVSTVHEIYYEQCGNPNGKRDAFDKLCLSASVDRSDLIIAELIMLGLSSIIIDQKRERRRRTTSFFDGAIRGEL